MASIVVALFALGMGFGNLVGVAVVKAVDDAVVKAVDEASDRPSIGRVKWLANDPNENHYDYYYWLLTFLGLVNFLYYLLYSWTYGSRERSGMRIWRRMTKEANEE